MEKLIKLIGLCKGSVSIEINSNRDSYTPADRYFDELDQHWFDQIGDDLICEMIARQSIVEIQFYPETSVGFYKIWHWDVEQAIDEAIRIIEEERKGK